MNEPDVNVQPKPGRALRRWGVVLMVLAVVLGMPVVGGSGWAFYQSVAQEMLVRGLVPGTLTFTVDQPGKYVLFYEYKSVVDGQDISTIVAPPQFTLTLEDPQGDEVTIEPYHGEYRYEMPAYRGVAINTFTLDTPGEYTLTADSAVSRQSVLCVGRNYAGYMVGGILGMFASCMFFLLFLVGLILLIVGLVTQKGPPVHPDAMPPQAFSK